MNPPMTRRDELAAGLTAVRQRIAAACAAAGRDEDDVRLTVVTKFFPASDVRLLAELGVHDVGENRHQEAEQKARDAADADVRWHFIGGLQSNKAVAVAAYADVVESVDRAKLVDPLDRGARDRRAPVECLIQVSLDEPSASGRSGADPVDVLALATLIDAAPHLELRGVMGVAPLGEDPARAFARLQEVSRVLSESHPAAAWISAGMSGDLEEAIRFGATHVRVGSAVLGKRPVIK
jgi:pyridoxal phosphate enzyme (YggS family)